MPTPSLPYHLILHLSNRTEVLFEDLAELLEQTPPAPLTRLPFLIQGRGMERWLTEQLTRRFGVWASGEFLFPHHFFDQLAQQLGLTLTEQPLDRAHLRWWIEALLRTPRFAEDPDLAPLLARMAPRQRFRFAEVVANAFDQYQLHRPDWLAAWRAGVNPLPDDPDAGWQMRLWQSLALTPHRGELWLQLIERLERESAPSSLPEQVFVFGISFLPPLMLGVLRALSRHSVVHLFLLSPCATYWSDLPSRSNWRTALEAPNALPEGEHHPLLVAFGRQGAHFQRLLLESGEAVLGEIAHFVTTEPATTLTEHLTNDLCANRVRPLPAHLTLNLAFHRCHTPLREVEALRDAILRQLRENPDLTPNQIVVMSPAIEVYRPFIAALFADLPHTIADRTLAHEAPALELLNRWLTLAASDLGWDAVWDFLHQPAVRARFGWRESDLDLLYERVVVEGGARCDLTSPYHRNHWQAATDRLLLGAVLAPDVRWGETAPLPLFEGLAVNELVPLLELLTLLGRWHAWATDLTGVPAREWATRLTEWADCFFGNRPDGVPLREAIAAWEAETEPLEALPVPFATLAAWAETLGAERRTSSGFLGQGITFCDLLPMRAVPIDCLFLIGMNDQSFPRATSAPSFDLMRRHFRLGDRDLRAEDRYTFLELLLSVRQRLELFWQGLSPDTNEALPPAAVVMELQEVLQERYGLDLAPLTHTHRAYPFHSDYFTGRLPASEDLEAYAIAQRLTVPPPFPSKAPSLYPESPPPVPTTIDGLAQALLDPVGWQWRAQGVAPAAFPEPPASRPLWQPDPLTEWQLRQRAIGVLLTAESPEAALLELTDWLRDEGRWPLHEVGDAKVTSSPWFAPLLALATDFRTKAAPLLPTLPAGPPPQRLMLPVAGGTLTHLLNRPETGYCTGEGLFHFHPQLARSTHLLPLWLQHLMLNACLGKCPSFLWLLTRKHQTICAQRVTFAPLAADAAQSELATWLDLLTPLPLWTTDGWNGWLEKTLATKIPPAAEEEIARTWQKAVETSLGLGAATAAGPAKVAPWVTGVCPDPSQCTEWLAASAQRVAPRLAYWQQHLQVTPLSH